MPKVTKKEMLTNIITYLESAPPNMDATPDGVNPEDFLNDAILFCQHEVELLNKKHNAKSGPTKTQIENAAIKSNIVDALTEPMRATAVAESCEISVQKASALLRQLVIDGKVVRHQDKKITTFSLV